VRWLDEPIESDRQEKYKGAASRRPNILKENPGTPKIKPGGSPDRSRHELLPLFKKGPPLTSDVELGRKGRWHSNV
jgi:hypothetical protein